MSPFRRPSEPLRQLLSADREYLVQLYEIKEKAYDGPPRYNDKGQPQGSQYVWKFAVWDDESLEPIVQDNGLTYSLHSTTSDSTFYDPNGGARTSRARDMMHALAGRVLSDQELEDMINESAEGIPEDLVGEYAIAEMRSYKDQNGNDRVGLGRLRALKPKQRANVEANLGGGVMEVPEPEPQERPIPARHPRPAPAQPRLPTSPPAASVASPRASERASVQEVIDNQRNGTDPDAPVGEVDESDIPF